MTQSTRNGDYTLGWEALSLGPDEAKVSMSIIEPSFPSYDLEPAADRPEAFSNSPLAVRDSRRLRNREKLAYPISRGSPFSLKCSSPSQNLT